MLFDGRQVQNGIYTSGESPRPVRADDSEARAVETLAAGPYGDIAGSGADVVKAMALDANAVLVGRPCVYALVAAGEDGVALMGASSVSELDSSWIAASS